MQVINRNEHGSVGALDSLVASTDQSYTDSYKMSKKSANRIHKPFCEPAGAGERSLSSADSLSDDLREQAISQANRLSFTSGQFPGLVLLANGAVVNQRVSMLTLPNGALLRISPSLAELTESDGVKTSISGGFKKTYRTNFNRGNLMETSWLARTTVHKTAEGVAIAVEGIRTSVSFSDGSTISVAPVGAGCYVSFQETSSDKDPDHGCVQISPDGTRKSVVTIYDRRGRKCAFNVEQTSDGKTYVSTTRESRPYEAASVS